MPFCQDRDGFSTSRTNMALTMTAVAASGIMSTVSMLFAMKHQTIAILRRLRRSAWVRRRRVIVPASRLAKLRRDSCPKFGQQPLSIVSHIQFDVRRIFIMDTSA